MKILLPHLYHYIVVENPASKNGTCPKSRNPASQNPATRKTTNLAAGFWCWIPYRYRNQNHYPATRKTSLRGRKYDPDHTGVPVLVDIFIVYQECRATFWISRFHSRVHLQLQSHTYQHGQIKMYGTVSINVLANENVRSKKSLYGLDRISLWVPYEYNAKLDDEFLCIICQHLPYDIYLFMPHTLIINWQ